MPNEQTVRGSNFTCFHAGPMEGWGQFRLEPPDVPVPARGKLFLRGLLGSAGLEMSLNVVPPGKGIPFLHRHRQNDEVYVVVEGRGQFRNGDTRHPFGPGDLLFVPAGVVHRFEDFTDDLAVWVIFYGPEGGEARR